MTQTPRAHNDVKLGAVEIAVLRVLVERTGRVTGRDDLNRLAGLDGTQRRVDAALVPLRRRLGEGAIITIRRRGWLLHNDAASAARALLDSVT